MTRVAVITLGCPKNSADSDLLSGQISAAGLRLVDSPEDADVLIVNTCGFIAPACEESIDVILEVAELKRRGTCDKLLVCGCMVERHRDQLAAELPEVDAFFGLAESCWEQIVSAASSFSACSAGTPGANDEDGRTYSARAPRLRPATPYAYVKISDGCDRPCTFCTIPSIRGAHRSRSAAEIEDETAALVEEGVSEIIVVGQDTASWGSDSANGETLSGLLERMARRHDVWIRVMYLQPEGVTDALIETIATHENICGYFDIPFQHAARGTLKRMGRRGDGTAFLRLVERIRRGVPDAALRTSLIVGFPGESRDEFAELADFVREARFDYAGVFAYSAEEGTKAAALPDPVDADEVGDRHRMMGELADEVGADRAAQRIGSLLDVGLEGPVLQQEYLREGRSQLQAPEIDGYCLVKGHGPLEGRVRVRVVETDGYDLICEPE